MSIFLRAMDRLADFIWTGRKVTLRFSAEYRTACYAVPLINKLLAEDEDGEAYRTAIVAWHRAERPPLDIYHGHISFCRIDGPLQWVDDTPLPLGGLILSPGVTAHLNPFEADALRDHMRQAIEDAIVVWVREHDLCSLPPVPEQFDRRKADRKAKAMIAEWAAEQEAGSTPESGRADTGECCSDDTTHTLCTGCRKGPDHD